MEQSSQPSEADREDGTFQIYIMRHGPAVQRGSPDYPIDDERPLTSAGRKKMTEVAQGFKKIVKPDWIVTSPLPRARQTAEIVADFQKSGVVPELCDELRPGGSAQRLLELLAEHPQRKRVLLVGHEPDLTRLAGRIMGAGRQANLLLKKGGCCRIDLEGPPNAFPGVLVWWLTPRVLREIA